MITVTNLRKIFTEQGIKGAGKWKREDFNSAIIAAEFAAEAEAESRKPVAKVVTVTKAPKRSTKCTDCGRPEDFSGSNLCTDCREYAEDENTHSDNGHDVDANGQATGEYSESCRVCHPELDTRKAALGQRKGVSRAGQVIVAKGTEMHKSLLFKREAESKGWTVEIQQETYEGGNTRTYATATKGDESLSLAWEDKAYDYPSSSAVLGGKSRKIRNLKEALRVL
jgi:hypothetical protein